MRYALGVVCLLAVLAGCVHGPLSQRGLEKTETVPISREERFLASMERAVSNSLEALSRRSGEEPVSLGARVLTTEELIKTLEAFLEVLRQTPDGSNFWDRVGERFDFYQVPAPVTFTAYYEPLLTGSLVETDRFRYPLYKLPPEIEQERAVHTREAIDSRGVLAGRGLELVYLDDPVERFFLHIQGAGTVRLPGNQLLNVQYDGSNGLPYRSIGKVLIDEGKLEPREGSLPGIKGFLESHPSEMERLMNLNERYIFFKASETGTQGVHDVELTPYRSLATDPAAIPVGSLLFYSTSFPEFGPQGRLTGWKEKSAFAVSQDVGDAIRGLSRADIFTGGGALAEATAGHLKTQGKLYVLLLKPGQPSSANGLLGHGRQYGRRK
ncbi:MAG: MltA domain-containing protein, partial [bacterium]|nr:MltA domain-containing protein [bacterium]